MNNAPERLWTEREAADYLGCAKTLSKLRKGGKIPHIWVNAQIRYRPDVVRGWLGTGEGGEQ